MPRFDNVISLLGMVAESSPSSELRTEYAQAVVCLLDMQRVSDPPSSILPKRRSTMDEVPEANEELESQLAELELTEIVQIVRRPDENPVVDAGDLDMDTTISLIVQGLVTFVIDELYTFEYVDEDDDDDED